MKGTCHWQQIEIPGDSLHTANDSPEEMSYADIVAGRKVSGSRAGGMVTGSAAGSSVTGSTAGSMVTGSGSLQTTDTGQEPHKQITSREVSTS